MQEQILITKIKKEILAYIMDVNLIEKKLYPFYYKIKKFF